MNTKKTSAVVVWAQLLQLADWTWIMASVEHSSNVNWLETWRCTVIKFMTWQAIQGILGYDILFCWVDLSLTFSFAIPRFCRSLVHPMLTKWIEDLVEHTNTSMQLNHTEAGLRLHQSGDKIKLSQRERVGGLLSDKTKRFIIRTLSQTFPIFYFLILHLYCKFVFLYLQLGYLSL